MSSGQRNAESLLAHHINEATVARDSADYLTTQRVGHAALSGAMVAFILIALPLVWQGAPVADDFNNCVASAELGVSGFIKSSWNQLGAIRPARFLEILLAAAVCRSLPFGIAIVVPLILTLAVALLTRALLRELGTPGAWASIGGALWLLQPLGTEAGLWPAALHVPLGLAFALISVRFYRRGRYAWGALTNLGAALSVEQVILPISLVAWLVAPKGERRRTLAATGAVTASVIVFFLLWPGANPRLRSSLIDRIVGLAADPAFYVGYPIVGLGLHSIPLAVWWALPWSLALLALGAVAGWRIGPELAAVTRPISRVEMWRGLVTFAAVIVLTNVLVVFAIPQQGSPRVFTPTWLVLSIGAAMAGASVGWRHGRMLGTAAGLFAAGALLSLMFSVSVRLRSADFTERAASIVATRIPDGGTIAVCGVRRTVVERAPRGAFAVHEFIYEWAAERAVQYYTGRRATIYLSGELWGRPCPPVPGVDAIVEFDEILRGDGP